MKKDEYIPVKVDRQMKKALDKLAKENQRERSQYIRLLFQYAIDNKLKF